MTKRLFLVAFGLMISCIDKSSDDKPLENNTESVNPEKCDDAVDNDGDGLIDCNDQDCHTHSACEDTGTDTDTNGDTGSGEIDNDADGVPVAEDCDDNDSALLSSVNDADCDGSQTADDCNDSDSSIHPNAVDIPGDGIDQDCSGPDIYEDFSQTGPNAVSIESKSTAVTDCTSLEYSVYTPNNVVSPPVMLLAHGFGRGADRMAGHAEHFASWGIEVLLPTLCHYGLFGVDHEKNGQNLVELANHHAVTNPIYAGQSAGGLAAIIAASMDQDAMGVLGLDATDTEDIPSVPDFIGQQYAATVAGTGMGLIGEPSSCNKDNNGIALFQMMPESQVVRVVGSDHCDYENPTDWGCSLLCPDEESIFSDEEIHNVVMQFSTAALMKISGLHSDGAYFWSSPSFDAFTLAGRIEVVQ